MNNFDNWIRIMNNFDNYVRILKYWIISIIICIRILNDLDTSVRILNDLDNSIRILNNFDNYIRILNYFDNYMDIQNFLGIKIELIVSPKDPYTIGWNSLIGMEWRVPGMAWDRTLSHGTLKRNNRHEEERNHCRSACEKQLSFLYAKEKDAAIVKEKVLKRRSQT